jgi:ribosome modulation factor
MSEYKPGSAYSEGFQARMKGVSRTSFTSENPVFIEEWYAGWDDAHSKIIEEARRANTCSKPNCCRKKNFIQD